ncbi:hypothetical protein GCM10025868_09760 [Angustibacter aerolatus]|uniref:Penicillin-binding protein dimerisation domain-containing protein n=1 Tax=Angustibacter aerolatus TaxID=1162965 RepID=A0ABQ6JDS9_9ACTN|nr:hypothetical protein [Angustibacter aerolatus]GMA85726.1 hypothetical protein GCM10025868_09760 [Angustibacter aerolatus]
MAEDVDPKVALQIMERREDFPGVTAEPAGGAHDPRAARRERRPPAGVSRPGDRRRACGPARRPPATGAPSLQRTDQIGRAGLEKQYDDALRGTPGVQTVGVDIRGRITGTLEQSAPVAGDHLVTSIDAEVQRAAEQALAKGIAAARERQDPGGRGLLKADSGAVVVLDVRTGQVVAMATRRRTTRGSGSAASPRSRRPGCRTPTPARRWCRAPRRASSPRRPRSR